MLKVMSFNANGIRSAVRKGFHEFLEAEQPDVICLQELKAHEVDIPAPAMPYQGCWHCAEKKGYSGVGILSRQPPDQIVAGIGREEFDREGRVLRADYGSLSVLSVYIPSGTTGSERQGVKMKFLDAFYQHTAGLLAEGRELIVCGDFNIAHQKIDLKNWRANQKTSGFLPEERAWLDQYLDLGLLDTFRELVGPEEAVYSWWSLRAGARERNVGWRLDYQLATPKLAATATCARIPRDPALSDHAPVLLEYDTGLS
ncbi:MAG TPA: exodeoxyribonuclease III [Trueperaceae bacterium]